MITVEKLEKGTYFDDAFKISFRYDPTTVAKVKELAERRYLPEDRAWEIPAHELPALIEKVGLSNIKSEEAVVQALNTKEIEDKREATQERLKGIKPVRDFDFKTAPLPHQIEAFNYGMEKNSLLIGDEQGLGKTKESIDICVARKKELIKTLIVCGVNSVKYNWEKEIQIHSNEGCVMVDGKTMDVRVQQLNDWYRGSSYFGVINIESLRNEKIQDALYLGIKDGYIGAIIVDEIHKAKNGGSQQGKALRFLKAPVKIGLSGTPMNKAEDLWNILTWLGVERRSFYSFRNAYCTTQTQEQGNGTQTNTTANANTTGAGADSTPKVKTEEEIRAELQKEYEKMADKRVTDAIKKKEKEWADKQAKEKMTEDERRQAEEQERLQAQAKKDLDLTIKGLKLDVVDAVQEMGLDAGFRNLIAVEDLATITDEDERKAKLTERVKGMKKLFDAEVAKEVTKAKAEFLKGTTPTTGTSTKNTEKDTYNKAKKAGDVKGMLDAKFYATEETD